MTFEDKFFFLKGRWKLKRTTNGQGHMHGIATFSEDAQSEKTLFYFENGHFHLPHQKGAPFYREYLYTFEEEQIHVFFARNQKKGELFHTLHFKEPCLAHTHHLCGQDTYEGTYAYLNENAFSLAYRITGPKKDIFIRTQYERLESP